MIARLRNESGQALVVTALFLGVSIGGTALTIDVGSWYREHRQAQTTADAAALAGAQSLPANTIQATSVATNYAGKNGGGVDEVNGVTFRKGIQDHDTVVVNITRTAPGFFARLFGIDSTQVHARAAARSAVPIDVRWAAPIVVNKHHPMLSGPTCPCFGQQTTIPLGKNGAPGSFVLIDLEAWAQAIADGDCDSKSSPPGNVGSSTLGDWLRDGFSGYLQLGCYASDPGAKFNSSNVTAAMNLRTNTTMLFPVYDTEIGQGSNALYHIIGWAAFHVDGFDNSGNSGSVTGEFEQVIWDGIQSDSGSSTPTDFGVHTIALVN